jgi:hypothetical protein
MQTQRRFIRMQQAGIGDKFHARRFGCIDHVTMLSGALADFAGGDQQQFFYARQCRRERRLVAVVGLTNDDTFLSQRRLLPGYVQSRRSHSL